MDGYIKMLQKAEDEFDEASLTGMNESEVNALKASYDGLFLKGGSLEGFAHEIKYMTERLKNLGR